MVVYMAALKTEEFFLSICVRAREKTQELCPIDTALAPIMCEACTKCRGRKLPRDSEKRG